MSNNNLSCLPFYRNIEEQNARKWWVYGRVYPLFAPANFLLPFQILTTIENANNPRVYLAELFTSDGVSLGYLNEVSSHCQIIDYGEYFAVVNNGDMLITSINIPNGRYYLKLGVYSGVMYSELQYFYSEIFTVVNDIEPYLKIEWWDNEDLLFDAGRIVFKTNTYRYKQRLYLQSDIAKPEYIFEDEGENRDGYFFPIKQISEKRYKFSFFASEYLLDVMRFIRMADHIVITYHSQEYRPDSFLITPQWESNGDVAAVDGEFETDTVVKKLGRGYLIPNGGSFNDDYNDDYDNQPNE